MVLLPKHGRIKCSVCFDNTVEWGVSYFEKNGWRLECNPGAWGSQQPVVLVLGVSKGTNQCNKITELQHEEIPFKGERKNLSNILNRLGLLPDNMRVDHCISETEQVFAFGSLIRCSIAMFDRVKEQWVKAGPVVKASATNAQAQAYVSACTQQFCSSLPERTKLVVMLSNDDEYVDACYSAFKRLYTDIVRHNAVSYGNSEHTWVHVIHPSGSSGRHIPDWLNKSEGKQASKREDALSGVECSGVLLELQH
jgi:hypothetical protein